MRASLHEHVREGCYSSADHCCHGAWPVATSWAVVSSRLNGSVKASWSTWRLGCRLVGPTGIFYAFSFLHSSFSFLHSSCCNLFSTIFRVFSSIIVFLVFWVLSITLYIWQFSVFYYLVFYYLHFHIMESQIIRGHR